MLEELSSLHVVHHEVDAVGLLKHVVHAHKEGVVQLIEDELFCLHIIYCVVLDYHVFAYALHRMVFLRLLAKDQVNFAKGPTAYLLDELKVMERGSIA